MFCTIYLGLISQCGEFSFLYHIPLFHFSVWRIQFSVREPCPSSLTKSQTSAVVLQSPEMKLLNDAL